MARHRARGTAPRAVGRVAGRVPAGRVTARVRPIELARTGVLRPAEPPPPVFADATGSRRRRLRRIAYAVGLLAALLLLGFWALQLGPP